MSSSGAVASTRAASVVPSGRRIVTETLPCTTWTFVRIVSGETKNPVPYAPPASTRTTAGIARLITSSSATGDGAAAGVTAGTRLSLVATETPRSAGDTAVDVGSETAGALINGAVTTGRDAATT